MPGWKSVPSERTGNADPRDRASAADGDCIPDGTAEMQCLWRDVHRSGYDRAAEVWHWNAFQPDGATGRTTGNAAPGGHAVGVDGGSREADQMRAGRVDPAGCAGQCGA